MTVLRYASGFVSTVLTNGLGSVTPGTSGTIQVGSITNLPAQYPFTLIIDWLQPGQEVVTVTQAATGSGPYTFANCVRGADGSAAPSHTANAQVVHGVSGRDFSNRKQVYSVLTYGADNSGVSDSTTAFSSCIADISAAGGGEMHLPAGTYKVNTAQLPVCTGLRIVGDGYQCTTVTCVFSGAGGYLFNCDPPGYSTSVHVEDFQLTGVTLDVTNADIFWGANLVRARFEHYQFIQRSAGNAIMNISSSTGTNNAGYLAECYFAGKEMVYGNPRTIEAWHLDWSATSLRGNDNTWERGHGKIWPTVGGDTSMYWMKVIGDSSGQTGSRHNTVRGLVFELSGVSNAGACGGLIHLLNTTNWLIDNISSEDLSTGTVGNPLILCNTSGSPGGCQAIQIRGYSRRGGSNVNATNPDIKLDGNCSGIVIDSPQQTSGGAALVVDLGGAANVGLTGAWPLTTNILNEAPPGPYQTWMPASTPQPEDLSYAGWSFDPAPLGTAAGTALTTAGVVYLVKIPVRMGKNVSTLRVHIVTAGGTLTAGQCFAGLYSASGSKICATADQATAWAGTGNLDMTLSSGPFLIQPPFVWAAFLFNGTTGPAFLRGNTTSFNVANGNTSAAYTRFGSILTGQTALPGSITPASIARIGTTYWAAVF